MGEILKYALVFGDKAGTLPKQAGRRIGMYRAGHGKGGWSSPTELVHRYS